MRDNTSDSLNKFELHRNSQYDYVDKTKLIEHFMRCSSRNILITRPKRTGKTLNISMLESFLDLNRQSHRYFKELYIASSPCYNYMNKFPVIHLNLGLIDRKVYRLQIANMIYAKVEYYLNREQMSHSTIDLLNRLEEFTVNDFKQIIDDIFNVYKVEPIILIDEYDTPLISRGYESCCDFISSLISEGIENNENVYKLLICGVINVNRNRAIYGAKNINIFDILTESEFDEDFGITNHEAQLLMDGSQLKVAIERYGNNRCGSKILLNIWSVINYLREDAFMCYWGNINNMQLIEDILTIDRLESLLKILKGNSTVEVTDFNIQIDITGLYENKSLNTFYALLLQVGYLSYENKTHATLSLLVPNLELEIVWRHFLMFNLSKISYTDWKELLDCIDNSDEFIDKFDTYVNRYNDLVKYSDDFKRAYCIMLMVSLNVFRPYVEYDYKIESNKYILYVMTTDFDIIFKFKDKDSFIESNKLQENNYMSNSTYEIDILCDQDKCVIEGMSLIH